MDSKAKSGTLEESGMDMYLPRKTLEEWAQKIEKEPILFPQDEVEEELKTDVLSGTINQLDAEENTPLHLAIQQMVTTEDYYASIKQMIDLGADLRITNKAGKTCLDCAHQGNIGPLYAILSLAPQDISRSFILKHLETSLPIKKIFIQVLDEREKAVDIPILIADSELPQELQEEFFLLYIKQAAHIDPQAVDKEGNNIIHLFCKYCPSNASSSIIHPFFTRENHNAKNQEGKTPLDLAERAPRIKSFLDILVANPDDYLD